MTMSDRIAVMNRGRYEQLGDPESLYERPTDPVRRRLPRRQQPPAGHRRRARPTATRSASWPTTRASAPRARSSTATSTSTSASGPRRSGCASRPRRSRRRGHNQLHGVVRDASYLGVSDPVPGRGARRRPPDRLRAERRASDARRAVVARRRGPADLVAGPQLRRRRRHVADGAGATAAAPDEPEPWHRPAPSRHPRPHGGDTDDRSARAPTGGHQPPSVPAGQRPRRHGGLPRGVRHARAGLGGRLGRRVGRREPGASRRGQRQSGAAARPRPTAARSASPTGSATSTSDRRWHDLPDHREVPDRVRHQVEYANGEIDGNEIVLHERPAGRRSSRRCRPSWDIVVVTDWMAAKVARLGWAREDRHEP